MITAWEWDNLKKGDIICSRNGEPREVLQSNYKSKCIKLRRLRGNSSDTVTYCKGDRQMFELIEGPRDPNKELIEEMTKLKSAVEKELSKLIEPILEKIIKFIEWLKK